MLKLYKTENVCIYEKLEKLLGGAIKKTANGKPYIEGNPVHFSVAHTGGTAVFAVSDNPVGIDAELIKELKFSSVIKRFTAREQAEINGDAVKFLHNWVVKEAFIKLIGGTLAHDLKRLECFDGNLFFDGIKPDCNILCLPYGDMIFAVCAESGIPKDIKFETI